ncbi:hypothetical protein [Halorubrum ezzemoulense]|uniref:hypothetical protein n=1 Tax=Halorubrum ezzemoulense TaxID=337243 RepID=UPI00232C138D|nr:hypothetical protein [Halorubrum ezzemoulense]MDB9233853.1 hypothetical protein [Halorubrum ezzemoulense]
MSASWQSDETPEYDEMSTIPIPSDGAVRDVVGNARCLDVDGERVTAITHGLVPPQIALDQLLFNPEPTRPEIIDGTIVVYLAEPLHVEGRDRDGVIRATVRADAETHEIESVELTAGIA